VQRAQAACGPQNGLQSASLVHGKHSPALAQYPALPVVVKQSPISPVLVVQSMFWLHVAAIAWHPPVSWALHFFLPFLPLQTPEQQSFFFLHVLPKFLQPGPAAPDCGKNGKVPAPETSAARIRLRDGAAARFRDQRSKWIAFTKQLLSLAPGAGAARCSTLVRRQVRVRNCTPPCPCRQSALGCYIARSGRTRHPGHRKRGSPRHECRRRRRQPTRSNQSCQ
jgi:hypothetical protein